MSEYETVRAALEARLLELNERAEKIDEDLSERADDDWADNATESEGDEVLERVGRAAIDEIRQVKAALSAIASGTYGTCTECNGQIAPERLEVVPMTTKCRRCA